LALTAEGAAAAASAAAAAALALPAAKYKVHEEVTAAAKESVYVLLDFSARTWKKTKKVKKLNKD